ncbi:phage terminase large subunit-like protein [Aminobacter niigataensis]|uniref:Phage terminase large subunit-like protein n=1 Tax=Aminobacter niigataensis TaxID=83265 RepID=A0ABR6L863_9HYPH|nr:terminase large subunit [Aminobacter niigataensis]MBB4652999.1 phage terminase large subunit-like protein [Aminobacter niigataensis]
MYATLACPDWVDRLKSGRSLIPDLPLDRSRADRAVAIFNKLRLPDVGGQPSMAEAAGDWFREIVAALFGGFMPDSDDRFIREIFTLVPKKNSKTTGGAGIMMTALIMNERPRAEFLLIGPTQAVSDTAFSQAVGMIQADPYLTKRFHIKEHVKEIRDRTNGAKLKIKTFDTKVLVGSKPVGVLIDEIHELGKIASAARVLRQIRGGILPFPEGFVVFITTQSDEPPVGVFRSELIKARMIRDGKAQSVMLPVLYEFPVSMMKDGSWKDPANWWMVTPNRDRSITIERLIEGHTEALLEGDAALKIWASQHLNIEIGLALQDDNWAGAEFWPLAANKRLTLQEVKRRSSVIVIGIDGGGLDDLLGIAVMGRCKFTGKNLLWSHAWAHEIVKKRRPEIASKLDDLSKLKQLTFVKLPGEDVYELAGIVFDIEASGLLAAENSIGVDSFGVAAIRKALTKEDGGIAKERIVGIPQGWKLNGAIKDAERDLAGGQLVHAGLELMDFAVGNAKVVPRGNAVAIDKQVSGSAKIDPLMAALHAQVLMGLNPVPAGVSGWDTDDLDALEEKIAAAVLEAEARHVA